MRRSLANKQTTDTTIQSVASHRLYVLIHHISLSSCLIHVPGAVSGLTIGAERALLEYESVRRVEENHARRQARLDLGRRGIIPTESEIAKWRSAKESESESS